MSFATPLGFIGLLAIPLIIIFYILKQKRENVTVSSLILWSRVLQDMQAKTPWQRLRKNLLLFLQILAALFIILALTGFSLKFGSGADKAVILVIDNSLSMASTDIKPTRLDAAKIDAIGYVDSLDEKSRVTVVSIGREADVLLYSSLSKDEIKNSIDSIQQTTGFVDTAKAEELVLSLKKQDNSAQISLFSDTPLWFGNEEVQFSEYKRQTNNIAIVSFSHNRSNENITMMSVIRNQDENSAEISVSLYGDEEFLDSQWVTIPENQTKTIWWDNIPATVKSMQVTIDTEDILEIDNNAYETVQSDQSAKVLLVTEGNVFLEKVFSLIEGVELIRTTPGEMMVYNGYDLYILDGVIPKKLPEDGNIVIFSPQPNNLFPVGEWMDTPKIIPSKHSIFKYLDSMNFSIGRTRIMEEPQWADTIMEYNQNPIIMEGMINNIRILIFGFSLYETDLPLMTEFPILISNIIDEYAPYHTTVTDGLITGDAVQFRLHPDTIRAGVTLPDGRQVSVSPPIPAQPFIDTEAPGIYSLEQIKTSENVSTLFAVNLPDEFLMEKDTSVVMNTDSELRVHIPMQKSEHNLTLPLLAFVIIILLFEWWYYANRNYT